MQAEVRLVATGPDPSFVAFLKRDYETCVETSELALKKAPSELLPLLLHLISLERLGQSQRAYEQFHKARAIPPWGMALAALCLGRGDPSELLAVAMKCQGEEQAHKIWQVNFCYGAVLISHHRWGQAREILHNILTSNIPPVSCPELALLSVEYNYITKGSSQSDLDDHIVKLNLATAQCSEPKAQLAKAKLAYQAARKDLGRQHPAYLVAVNNLLAAHIGVGQYAEAGPLAQDLVDLRRAACGEDDPDLAEAKKLLVAVKARQALPAIARPPSASSPKASESKASAAQARKPWLEIGLASGWLGALAANSMANQPVWWLFATCTVPLGLLLAFGKRRRPLPAPIQAPAPERSATPAPPPSPRLDETVLRLVPAGLEETVLRPPPAPEPDQTVLRPSQPQPNGLEQTVLRSDPKKPAPADFDLDELKLRAKPRVNLGPTPGLKPMSELSLREMVEFHARAYQVSMGLAEGAQAAAAAFKAWLESYRVEAAQLPGGAPSAELVLSTPTGEILWRELEGPIRFVVLSGESAFRIPTQAAPVPPVEAAAQPSSLVSVLEKKPPGNNRRTLYGLLVEFYNQAALTLQEDESHGALLEVQFENILMVHGSGGLELTERMESYLEFLIDVCSIVTVQSFKLRTRAYHALHFAYFALEILKPGSPIRESVSMLLSLAELANEESYDVFEVGPERLRSAQNLYQAVVLACALTLAPNCSARLDKELDDWLTQAQIIMDDEVNTDDRGRRSSHALYQFAQRLKSATDQELGL